MGVRHLPSVDPDVQNWGLVSQRRRCSHAAHVGSWELFLRSTVEQYVNDVAVALFLSETEKLTEIGRRSVYIFSLVVVLAACLWLAFVDDIGGWQGAHVLIGLGAAPFEALPAISIADIFFAHERGGKIGWYVFGLSVGSCK